MARETIQRIIDDVDGTELDPSDVIVETFTINGVDYQLDLGGKSAEKFDKDMQKWIDKATKIGGRAKRSTNKQAPAPAPATNGAAPTDKAQLAAIRDWAGRTVTRCPTAAALPRPSSLSSRLRTSPHLAKRPSIFAGRGAFVVPSGDTASMFALRHPSQ
jgi:hypothetical protein